MVLEGGALVTVGEEVNPTGSLDCATTGAIVGMGEASEVAGPLGGAMASDV